MATIFQYVIIDHARRDYRSEGVSHQDALRRFVLTPTHSIGFHSGDYDAEDGETFIVVGPTQDKPTENEVIKFVSQKRQVTVFKTPEQMAAEAEARGKVASFLRENQESQREIKIIAEDNSTPPAILVGWPEIRGDLGVRVNNQLVPWGAVRGIEFA
jgi:hypothetical protein